MKIGEINNSNKSKIIKLKMKLKKMFKNWCTTSYRNKANIWPKKKYKMLLFLLWNIIINMNYEILL